jgi:hypothetical protein
MPIHASHVWGTRHLATTIRATSLKSVILSEVTGGSAVEWICFLSPSHKTIRHVLKFSFEDFLLLRIELSGELTGTWMDAG